MQLEYYGFSDKPFELSPDLRFLYLTAGYRIALEAVGRGITDRRGLIVITGEVGTGKTMLIYGVMEKLPPKVKTAFIFHSTYNFMELLQQIFSELEESVPTEGIVELKNQFLLYLRRLKDQEKILAIFLDEAQKFSEEVFMGLFSLLETEPWVSEILQVLLVGQPEIEVTFRTAFLRYHPKINPLRIKINPLSQKESLEYIEHRMRTVGRSSADIFSPQALALILEKAGGIPRLINIIGDNALFAGYKASVRRIEAPLIEGIIRNLEGPDYIPNIKKMPLSKVTSSRLSYRLFIRDGLIVIFGFFFVFGMFLIRPELTTQLKNLSRFVESKLWLNQSGDPVEKTQSQKEYRKHPGRINLIPEGSRNPGEEKSLKGQGPAPSSSLVRIIQVKKGDYLSKLVFHHYGKINESLIDLVLNHNPSISNIDLVLVDQQIKLPELNEEILIVPASDKYFSAHLGTFASLIDANQLKNQPELKGSNITVKPKKVSPRETWYRVEAGPYESKQEALEVVKTLREKKLLLFF
jgi:general secretion pathway protein A